MHLKNFLYRSISHLHWVLAAALLLGIVSSAWGVGIGRAAATITVNSFEDKVNTDGLCTLREAVIAANKDAASSGNPGECPAGSGADTIVLPALIDNVAGSYILTRTDNGKEDSSSTGDLDITSDITIQGDGGQVVIKTIPGYKDRVFHILSGTTSIKNVTIQGGIPVGDGGGIYNKASLTIEQSTLAGNIATGNGGALYNSGTLTLTNVTLSGNNASLSGGGLYSTTGTTTLNNVTVSANTADKDGNGTGDGGGVFRNSGTLSLANSIIGGNSDGSAPNKRQPDCSGSLASLGYNLVQSVTGCTLTGIPTGNRTGVNPNLGPLADNGGPTPTHKLLNGSPAIEAGNPAAPGSSSSACALTDQRGVTRPQGAACDIGAFEAEDPLQTGPVFSVIAVVGTNDDRDDGACTFSHCSLREAIQAANARPNDATPDAVHFNLSGGSPVIMVTSPLPEIASPVIIDGATQPGGTLVLNGSGAGADVSGLTVSGGGSTLKGLTIREFSCNGVLLTGSGGNTLQGNTITLNGCNGIHVASGGDNKLTQNLISANGLLAIDLGGDGPTANDTGDADAGANDLQNYPVLFGADPFAEDGVTVVEGRLNGIANTAYALEFFSNQACDVSGFGEAETFLDSVTATTDSRGDAYFQTRFTGLPADRFVSVTATSPTGDTSELSACKRVDARNDSWPAALPLTLSQNGSPVSANQYLDQQGQSRWYFFKIQPNTRLVVTLTGLTANYDLTLYKDIKQAYTELNGDQDLVRLGAEFAADAFNADSFSSDAFNSDAFSPQAFSPQAFSPQAFSPQAFSPQAFSPQAFSPQAFSPEAFLADAYAPQAFSPQAFSPQAFSPQAFSPQAFSPQAFSSAQTRSLIGVSAFDGTASEGLSLNTWENTGDFYVRVRGRNGAFDPSIKYHLEVTQIAGDCANVNTNLPPTSLTGESGSYRTIILTDFARLAGSADDEIALRDRLATFAARSEVRGVVVDVGSDARVAAANAEAERGDNFQCPFAKNQVAYAIKNIVDNYRAKNPLEYVVIIGSDEVVPFFRHADQAMLANEKNYAPPLLDDTASQASLKLGYVLSQDRYGTDLEISHKDESFPIPDLAVGRVVETASDATRMLDAYLNPNRGGILSPTSALVTGYDFLVDNAQAVREDLAIGLGSSSAVDTLITPPHLSPADPSAEVWTADDLRQELFDTRHDLIYLAGHFSAGSALAADFTTRVDSTELLTSLADLENVLIYSAGCHSGYNTVDPHGVPFVTAQPDWAQAANGEGITLIAGTGYQYGDTDFIEYSERLYLEFTRQLRAGSGPVPIGKALMEAKRTYLAETPQLRGIHEKALLEATLFGFPMFAVDMPGQRYTPGGGNTIVTDVSGYASDPGDSLGLEYSDVTINPSLTRFDVPLKNVENNATVMATYLKGKNGVLTNPVEPVLPAEVYNVSVANTVLRGVGFRGGDYTDLDNILPLIGAATTEVRGVHSPFVTEFFFPVRLWSVNYIDALANGPTRLVVTPAHFKLNEASADRGTLRRFDSLKFRLFYSDYVESNPDGTNPALSAAPSIVRVSGTPAGDAVDFQMRVVGNPAAGIQEVWVTYTAIQGSFYNQWQSLDLAQNPLDSTLWEGKLTLPEDVLPGDVRYVVQSANGVGLVAFDTNQGAFHTPRFEDSPTQQTALNLISPANTGRYGTPVEFTAQLTGSQPLPPLFLTFSLGPQSRRVQTGPDGRASASLSLLGIPGSYQVKVTFPGTAELIASKAESPFTIDKQSTTVQLKPQSATVPQHQDTGIVAIACEIGPCIDDQGEDTNNRRLGLKTVFFVVEGSNGAASKAVITDYAGRARLGSLALPAGAYTVTAYFGGENIPLKTNGTVTNVTQIDERYIPSSASGTLTLTPANNDPVCTNANALTDPPMYLDDLAIAWPPNSQLVPVSVVGVTDPDGDPVTITFTGIFQDERVGRGPASPDGFILGTNSAQVRAERDQNDNGRIYHLHFTASDGSGGACSAQVLVGVPPDQGGMVTPIDDGELYDSTIAK